jgi:predicted nucleotidyltransferase
MSTRRATTAKKPPTIEDFRPAILSVARRHGVRNVRVFGSFARNEQRKRSDVDLLVDLPDHFSLFDLAGLQIDLEEAVGRKVDVVSARSIKPALRDYILADARPL